jgi:hypothetical protein
MVSGPPPAVEYPKRPPIAEVAQASMALVVVGGVYLAAYLPRRAPLGPAVGLLAAAGALVVVNALLLAGQRSFAWDKFRLVSGWAFVAYLVIAGMLEYVFVLDHVRGTMLVLVTLMLVVFSVDIPVLLGFSVARYQLPEEEGAGRASPARAPGS